MKKVLSIVLCAMVLVAMLSSSAFAVVRSVSLSTVEKANNSLQVYGSWKLVKAYNHEKSAYAVHVLPQYKHYGSWWTQNSSKIKLSMGCGTSDTRGKSKIAYTLADAVEFGTEDLGYETYWRLRLNVDGVNKYGCMAEGTIRN